MRRWSAISGFVFVVLAIASRLVLGSVPDTEERGAFAKFTEYYAESSHNDRAVLAVVLGFIGLFAFAWFIGGLWSLLRTAEGATTMPTIVVAIGGAAFVALGITYHVLNEVVGVTLHFSDGYTIDHGFDPATALLFHEAARGALLGAFIAVGASTAAAAIVMLRTRAFPVWLAWVGIAVTVLSLPTIPPLTFAAAVLLGIWIVLTGIVMLRGEAPPRAITDPRLTPG
jgi:hypothetical protein